ncbi:hypothetical protein ABZV60_35700 [Streptomyces sp. NPDC004787]|uniref:hypothetical protein n=1 Tax=Streptomyces sp. NPDC004787 TaxID=3154291 RepID=UPI0033AF1326
MYEQEGPFQEPRQVVLETRDQGRATVTFRSEAPQPFDDRCLSWQYERQTVSLWTSEGRLKNIAFPCPVGALKVLRQYRKGGTGLIEGDGVFRSIATCEIPEPEP